MFLCNNFFEKCRFDLRKGKYMKIGILGYGNLGKGVEYSITQNPDMELVAVFTRRNPSELKINSNAQVVSLDEIEQWQEKIDVLILCGGSAPVIRENGIIMCDLTGKAIVKARELEQSVNFEYHVKIYY